MTDLFIGLMSGTSMDGIDAVLVDFSDVLPKIEGHYSLPLSAVLRDALLELCQNGWDEIDRMGQMDIAIGQEFAAAANTLIESCAVPRSHITAIGSHGQTIRHRPGLHPSFTLQIGDPNTVAELTGCTVVADFRRRDMAAGGQGAPLVPAFHQAIFRQQGLDRAILNLGGIANVTWLPGDPKAPVTGFDTGPANMLLDAWINRHRGKRFDENGQWAASGKVDPVLLQLLLNHPFLALPAPKSTGREDFHLPWLDTQLAQLPANLLPEDVQRTLLALTVESAAQAISRLMQQGELILCGGGAYNPLLVESLQQALPAIRVVSTSDFGIAPQWLEAMAFAWLARERMNLRHGNLDTVTGARGARILGGVYAP